MTHAEESYVETGGPGMTDSVRRSIPFTIDGKPFTTDDISQRASALLHLAGLDPTNYDLGELIGKDRPETKHFDDDEVVEITKDARFVSIRQKGPMA